MIDANTIINPVKDDSTLSAKYKNIQHMGDIKNVFTFDSFEIGLHFWLRCDLPVSLATFLLNLVAVINSQNAVIFSLFIFILSFVVTAFLFQYFGQNYARRRFHRDLDIYPAFWWSVMFRRILIHVGLSIVLGILFVVLFALNQQEFLGLLVFPLALNNWLAGLLYLVSSVILSINVTGVCVSQALEIAVNRTALLMDEAGEDISSDVDQDRKNEQQAMWVESNSGEEDASAEPVVEAVAVPESEVVEEADSITESSTNSTFESGSEEVTATMPEQSTDNVERPSQGYGYSHQKSDAESKSSEEEFDKLADDSPYRNEETRPSLTSAEIKERKSLKAFLAYRNFDLGLPIFLKALLPLMIIDFLINANFSLKEASASIQLLYLVLNIVVTAVLVQFVGKDLAKKKYNMKILNSFWWSCGWRYGFATLGFGLLVVYGIYFWELMTNPFVGDFWLWFGLFTKTEPVFQHSLEGFIINLVVAAVFYVNILGNVVILALEKSFQRFYRSYEVDWLAKRPTEVKPDKHAPTPATRSKYPSAQRH